MYRICTHTLIVLSGNGQLSLLGQDTYFGACYVWY